MKGFLTIFLIVILLLIIGLLAEKMAHPTYDIGGITIELKSDVRAFIEAFFKKPVVRHIFDFTLQADFETIISPYVRKGFKADVKNGIVKNVPIVAVRFVPENTLEQNSMDEIVNLLLIKFKEYLDDYFLNWKCFGGYSIGSEYVIMYIYYSELPSDEVNFRNVYKRSVRKRTKNSGVLRDEELDEELRDVH